MTYSDEMAESHSKNSNTIFRFYLATKSLSSHKYLSNQNYQATKRKNCFIIRNLCKSVQSSNLMSNGDSTNSV